MSVCTNGSSQKQDKDQSSISGLPLISVIVAVFNGAKTLQSCLNSICQQTYLEKEVIVIDGGSSDETVEILKRNDGNISFWRSERDHGIYDAWNKGIAKARGDWICFLGADDIFLEKDTLGNLSKHLLNAYPKTRIVYGRVAVINKHNDVVDLLGEEWGTMRRKFLGGVCLPTPSVMHHYTLFDVHGTYDERFMIAGDYEMLLRELKMRDALFVQEVITGMAYGGISSDPRNAMTSIREVGMALEKHARGRPWRWHAAVVRIRIRQVLWTVLGEDLARRLLDLGRRMMGKRKFWSRV